mgnify:CR=1 FL=1|jgi:hypothetical protein
MPTTPQKRTGQMSVDVGLVTHGLEVFMCMFEIFCGQGQILTAYRSVGVVTMAV